jgi:hypothetical protein
MQRYINLIIFIKYTSIHYLPIYVACYQEQPCHILLLVKFFQGVTPKSEISSSLTLYMWFYLLCPTISAEPCYGVYYSFSYLILWARNLISLTAVIPLRNKSDSDRPT